MIAETDELFYKTIIIRTFQPMNVNKTHGNVVFVLYMSTNVQTCTQTHKTQHSLLCVLIKTNEPKRLECIFVLALQEGECAYVCVFVHV